MPRVPDLMLNCAVYLYPDVSHAQEGDQAGGTGFLLSIPSERVPPLHHVYAITNRHVIEKRILHPSR